MTDQNLTVLRREKWGQITGHPRTCEYLYPVKCSSSFSWLIIFIENGEKLEIGYQNMLRNAPLPDSQ